MRYIDADELIEAFKDYPFGDSITLQNAIDIIDGFADTNKDREMYRKKQMETFLAVRDILKECGNAFAYNTCYGTPWKFYGKHSVEECVKILLDKCTIIDKSGNINYCPNCGAKMDGGVEDETD